MKFIRFSQLEMVIPLISGRIVLNILSYGQGYWGNGTPILNPAGTGFYGSGEVHGVIQLPGSFCSPFHLRTHLKVGMGLQWAFWAFPNPPPNGVQTHNHISLVIRLAWAFRIQEEDEKIIYIQLSTNRGRAKSLCLFKHSKKIFTCVRRKVNEN